ncbi:MAG: hypothetical protein ACI81T_003051 [Bacteroidia bacterium]|jgi:hypothetical protein
MKYCMLRNEFIGFEKIEFTLPTPFIMTKTNCKFVKRILFIKEKKQLMGISPSLINALSILKSPKICLATA